MIFVDTSIWITALRRQSSREGAHLSSLLDRDEVALAAVVRVELLAGASRTDLPRLRRTLSALPVFYPTERAWQRIESWIAPAVAAGERFGVADMLIAAIAAEGGGAVWSADADFARMARLRLIEIHRPE